MKLDKTYRKHAAKLLPAGEEIVAAPLLLHPTSGRMRTANQAPVLATDSLASGFAETLGLDGEQEVIPLGPLAVATSTRLVFFEISRTAISTKPRPKVIDGEYPLEAVSLSWSDQSLSGYRWRVMCFHFPDGRHRLLECQQGSLIRKPPNDEAQLMVEAFGDRAHQIVAH